MSFATVLQRLGTIENPYPGLRPFEPEDAHLFFGRDRQIAELITRLERNRFVAVIGVSGSGKSSLIRAGLIPALERGHLSASGVAWRIVVTRPAGAPFTNLTQQMEKAGFNTLPLRRSSFGLIHVAQQLPSDESLLVVVDQFEEIFRYKDQEPVSDDSRGVRGQAAAEAYEFVQVLLAASRHQPPVYIVITMRSDYLGDCAEFRDLPEALNECQYLIPRLIREERKQAIECPLGNIEISPALVQRMLNDAGDEPDQLPILQHALMRTWDHWHKADPNQTRNIELQDYEAIGGFDNVLDQHADELLKEVPRATAATIFKRLTARGQTDRERREPAMLSELSDLCDAKTPEERAAVAGLITRFRRREATFLLPRDGDLTPQTYIDIAHESLIRQWKMLRDQWLPDETKSAKTFLDLVKRSGNWKSRGGTLLSGLDLADAAEWERHRNRTPAWANHYANECDLATVLEFIQASQAEEHKRATREKRNFWIAVAISVVFAFLASVAVLLWKRAKEAEKTAITATGIAQTSLEQVEDKEHFTEVAKAKAQLEASRNLSHELAGASVNELSLNPAFGLLVALQAVSNTYRTPDKVVDREAMEALQVVQSRQARGFSCGHAAAVVAVAFSPNSSRISTAGADGTARVWDATSGVCLLALGGHNGPVNAVAFSRDGSLLATASDDQTAKVWEAERGKELLTLTGHVDKIRNVAFSPDGKLLATASQDGTVKIWDIHKGKETHTLPQTAAVSVVAFDEKHLATVGSDGIPRVWDPASGKELTTTKVGNEATTGAELSPSTSGRSSAGYLAVTLSSDGKRLATVSTDGTAKVCDVDGAGPCHALSIAQPYYVRTLAISPNGSLLAVGGLDRMVKILDIKSDKEVLTLDNLGGVVGLAFSSDGRRLATANAGAVHVWDVGSGQELVVPDLWARESLLAFSPNGKLLATTGDDGTLRLRDGASSLDLFTLSRDTNTIRITVAAFSYNGRYFAAISPDQRARVWDTSSGHEVHHFPIDGLASALAVSANGAQLATVGGKILRVWDTNSGKSSPVPSDDTRDTRPVVAFSPNGKLLATASEDSIVRVRDANSGLVLLKLPRGSLSGHQAAVDAVVFSPNSELLATASRDKTVKLWNIRTGTELHTLLHKAGVYTVAFSPDGRQLASASRDKTVVVWDVDKGEEVLNLSVNSPDGLRVAFHPDGDLIIASPDTIVREYPLNVDELIAIAQRHLTQSWTAAECHQYLHSETQCPSWTIALDYVVEGNKSLREDRVQDALGSFKKAHELDPVLQLDSQKEIKQPEAEALLAKGQSLASAGEDQGAIANFRRAKELDPELAFDPVAAVADLAGHALGAKGRNLARSGDLHGGLASLQKAKELDPSFSFDPKTEAETYAAQSFVARGRDQAKSGDINGAIIDFERAKELDPSLSLDPKTEAGKYEAQSLVAMGRDQAKHGDVDSAITNFLRAKELDPSLSLDPKTEAGKYAAQSLVAMGRDQAKHGDVDSAITNFLRAKELDPTLKLVPESEAKRLAAGSLLASSMQFVRQGKVKDAVPAYADAIAAIGRVQGLDPDGSIRAEAWNDLCWEASLRGHAAEVMEACDRAVKAAEQLDAGSWHSRDSRAVARALTGNTPGAIEDFQFFIDHAPDKQKKEQRQQWVDALRAGKKPDEVLKSLLIQ